MEAALIIMGVVVIGILVYAVRSGVRADIAAKQAERRARDAETQRDIANRRRPTGRGVVDRMRDGKM